MIKKILIPLFLICIFSLGHAEEATPLAEDPVVEQRLISISEEMRCLVCQNESLSGSRAELAQDLRREIRDLIKQGKTDAEIRAFMVDRYGDFVLYRPPVKPITWLLWIGPFVLMLAGIVALLMYLRRRNGQVASSGLSDDENKRIDALLRDDQ
jgi:cytochrome c-type biogenesis protein CcmH